MMPMPEQIAATSVCLSGKAFLIQGVSGAGKSSLALALLYRGASLISDDITDVAGEGASLMAKAPKRGRGCLEVRSLGIISGFPVCERAPVAAVMEIVPEKPERLAEAGYVRIGGHRVPHYRLWQDNRFLTEQAWTVVQMVLNRLKRVSTLEEE